MTTTWNASDKGTHVTLSNGNLTATGDGTAAYNAVRSTDSKSTGKWYAEARVDAGLSGAESMFGVMSSTGSLTSYVGSDAQGWGVSAHALFNNAYHSGSSTPATSGTWAIGDIIQIAWDADAGKLWFGRNNTFQGSPAAGTGNTYSSVTGTLFAAITTYNSIATTARFTAASQSYTAPSGFSAWEGVSNAATMAVTETQDTTAQAITVANAATFAITGAQDTAAVSITTYTAATMAVTENADVGAFTGVFYTQAVFALTETQDIGAFRAQDADVIGASFAISDTQDVGAFGATFFLPDAVNFALTEAQDTLRFYNGVQLPPAPFIAAVGDGGKILISIDGITWSLNNTLGANLYTIAQTEPGGTWVIGGYNGALYTSTDFITWTSRTSSVSSTIRHLAYNGSYWVGVGLAGKIIKSTDGTGTSWATAYSAAGSPQLNRVAWVNSLWVAVGVSGKIYTSPDAVTWTQRVAPNSNSGLGIGTSGSRIVVSTNGAFWTSTNGTTWSTFATPSTDPKWAVATDGSRWNTAGGAAATGASKTTTTTTLTAWTTVTLPISNTLFNDIIYDSTLKWCQVGNVEPLTGLSGVLTSADGTHWTKRTTPTTVILRGVTVGTGPINSYSAGDFIVTESQDTAFFWERIPGTLAATETADVMAFSGISMGDVGMTFAVSAAQDTAAMTATAVFATTVTATFALSAAQDSISSAATVISPSVVAGFVLAETPDTFLFSASNLMAAHGSFTLTETQDVPAFREIAVGGALVTIQILPATFDAIVTYGATLFDGGTLDVYSGSQPLHPSSTATGTKLITITLPDPAFLEAADGSATKSGTWSGSALDNGICGWFRLTSSDGDNIVDGTVTTGLGDGNLTMSTTTVTTGDPIEITTANFEFDQVLS